VDVLHGRNKRSTSFQMKRSRVKVTGCQKPQQTGVVYLRSADEAQADQALLGLIYCRSLSVSSATGRPAACHVGTRRRHVLVFDTGQKCDRKTEWPKCCSTYIMYYAHASCGKNYPIGIQLSVQCVTDWGFYTKSAVKHVVSK